jgi:hypothetical protein
MDELRRRAQTLLDRPPVEPTPVAVLARRVRQRRMHRAVATLVPLTCVVVAVLVAVGVFAESSHGTRVEVAPTTATSVPAGRNVGAPDTFVSTRVGTDGRGLVGISDARTGRLLQTLLTLPANRVSTVSGTAIAPNGDVWITVNRGPKYLGHVDGGNPQPHTCASTVLAVDPRTKHVRTVMRGGDDELIDDVQPSPVDGRVAYLHSGCVASYFESSLEIKDLASGAVVNIGDALPRCHKLWNPRWTADGRNVVVVYGKASTPNYAGGPGTCSELLAAQVTVVSADRPQDGMEGVTSPNATGCEVNAVAATKDGYAGVEHCGAQFISGPTALVRYDRDLHVVSRSPLGECENGASIGGDGRTDRVIVSTYQFCGASLSQAATKVFVASGADVRHLLSLPGGYTAIDTLAF